MSGGDGFDLGAVVQCDAVSNGRTLVAGDIDCAHQPGEFLEMSRLEPTVRLLRELIHHYCLQPVKA